MARVFDAAIGEPEVRPEDLPPKEAAAAAAIVRANLEATTSHVRETMRAAIETRSVSATIKLANEERRRLVLEALERNRREIRATFARARAIAGRRRARSSSSCSRQRERREIRRTSRPSARRRVASRDGPRRPRNGGDDPEPLARRRAAA